MRPSRRALRALLRMRSFLLQSHVYPHPEAPREARPRRTHDLNAGRIGTVPGGGRAWWRIAHPLDSADRCRNWTRDEPHRRVAGHVGPQSARDQSDRRTRTPPRRAGPRARDRAARLRDDPGIEFLRQHGAVYGAGAGDRTHRLRHRDRADLRADGGGVRAWRRLYPRGLGRTVSVRHRRRARPELRADGRDPRQAARRYQCLCRQVPRL